MKKTVKGMFRLLAALLVAVMIIPSLSGLTGVSYAASGYSTSGRTGAGRLSMAELRKLYYAIPEVTSIYSTEPVISGSNYRPSVLSQTAYANALGWINYYRQAAGLGKASFTDTLNSSASYGALCMAMEGYFSHYPPQPADMSDEDYQIALAATSSSNISYSYGYPVSMVLQVAISGQMGDRDASNLDRLGHRRWLLHPATLTFGIGTANDGSEYYTDIRVFGSDVSTKSVTDYNFIAWPASGDNLSDTFSRLDPWSITLNPDRYAEPDYDKVSIKLTRLSDNTSWTFSSKNDYSYADYEHDFFNINNDGYGISNCIVFRPACSEFDDYNGKYEVSVSGVYDNSGKAANFKYLVNFEKSDAGVFYDVPPTHSYYKAVMWAYNNGIAAGYTGDRAGFFGVSDNITRGQVATFLWRAAGQPAPKGKKQTFTDVPTSSNFYKAIQWAYEQGITGGYTGDRAGQFGPSDNCTRGQIVTFLWRYVGKPKPKKNTQTFTDVPTTHNFYKAIQWASEEGITAGYSDGTFGVNKTCTRGHCVTFLYRLLGN